MKHSSPSKYTVERGSLGWEGLEARRSPNAFGPAGHRRIPEEARVPADGDRVLADGDRVLADGDRVPADGDRVPADGDRVAADGERVPADGPPFAGILLGAQCLVWASRGHA